MALIKCPECGRDVSDKAEVCPGCGRQLCAEKTILKKNKNSNKRTNIIIGFIVVFIIGIVLGMFLKTSFLHEEANQLSDSKETIRIIENTITSKENGYSEKIKLFGLDGTVTYTNTLSDLSEVTNTATWQPNEGMNTDKIYDDIVSAYGEPKSTGGTYWSWSDGNGMYRIVLQHGNLGINLVIQRESSTL